MLPPGDYPNTVSGLVFGYGFAALVLTGYIISLVIRGINARRDHAMIEDVAKNNKG